MTTDYNILRGLNIDHSAHHGQENSKPRVLVYCINYAPELTGISKYTTERAE